jgi:hypothetical protein
MKLANPKYLMLVGITQLNFLKVKAILLRSSALLVHKGNGKLLYPQPRLKAPGITTV